MNVWNEMIKFSYKMVWIVCMCEMKWLSNILKNNKNNNNTIVWIVWMWNNMIEYYFWKIIRIINDSCEWLNGSVNQCDIPYTAPPLPFLSKGHRCDAAHLPMLFWYYQHPLAKKGSWDHRKNNE